VPSFSPPHPAVPRASPASPTMDSQTHVLPLQGAGGPACAGMITSGFLLVQEWHGGQDTGGAGGPAFAEMTRGAALCVLPTKVGIQWILFPGFLLTQE